MLKFNSSSRFFSLTYNIIFKSISIKATERAHKTEMTTQLTSIKNFQNSILTNIIRHKVKITVLKLSLVSHQHLTNRLQFTLRHTIRRNLIIQPSSKIKKKPYFGDGRGVIGDGDVIMALRVGRVIDLVVILILIAAVLV